MSFEPVTVSWTAEAIQAWIVSLLAEKLDINPNDIDVEAPFQSFDLNSVDAMVILSKLEKRLGYPLSPTLVWNYPTIELLSQRLAQEADSLESVSLVDAEA
ncbi:MAG: acyl carrier protein [Cyanomargarita calcarea GSE-NOS-MK-12-04C]|jgi:acyl carrier protein|uniref:Acyl carrier protein n=1 Tax=Cyanomargarita calcarea GSE-NOS-MK-12-04C TaxID=2839659 RepID=A0A951QQG0_9CYAN|nr:acyl carrier protein [Cyanomargarita calcarea GSE-NOS-MK-12-04C]